MRRVVPIAAAAGAVCLAVAASGCGAPVTGARREGPGPVATVRPARASQPAIASDRAALAALVRDDATVSEKIRDSLVPCAGQGVPRPVEQSAKPAGGRSSAGVPAPGASPSASAPADDYPVDADSGDLTSGDGPDLLVTVSTCGDGVGIAAYVYRLTGGTYHCVFADERPPVYGSLDSGRLRIVHQVYRTDDQVAYPSGEDEALYAWRSGHFVEVGRYYSDLTAKNPTPSPEPTSTRPVPLPTPADQRPSQPSAVPSLAAGAVVPDPATGARGGTAGGTGSSSATGGGR